MALLIGLIYISRAVLRIWVDCVKLAPAEVLRLCRSSAAGAFGTATNWRALPSLGGLETAMHADSWIWVRNVARPEFRPRNRGPSCSEGVALSRNC